MKDHHTFKHENPTKNWRIDHENQPLDWTSSFPSNGCLGGFGRGDIWDFDFLMGVGVLAW